MGIRKQRSMVSVTIKGVTYTPHVQTGEPVAGPSTMEKVAAYRAEMIAKGLMHPKTFRMLPKKPR